MSGPSLRNLDDYGVRAVAWLDKPFLQASAFILLAGRKGTIKGTLSCRLAALCTIGELYPVPRRNHHLRLVKQQRPVFPLALVLLCAPGRRREPASDHYDQHSCH